jgi:hypothetical protein
MESHMTDRAQAEDKPMESSLSREDRIRLAAHRRWLARGGAHGNDHDDWLAAEAADLDTDTGTGLAGQDKALERMSQERASPGRDTAGGDATATDAEGTAARRGASTTDKPTNVVKP